MILLFYENVKKQIIVRIIFQIEKLLYKKKKRSFRIVRGSF